MELTMEVREAIKKYDPMKPYTYADYITWGDDLRCELFDGEIIVMEAPSIDHQRVSRDLTVKFAVFLEGKKCEVFAAPFDVCLFGQGDLETTILQPDIVIICDDSKFDKKKCNGAPDLVIEILSPSTMKYDKHKKSDKYMQAGVREYWMVDPVNKNVSVCIFEKDNYSIGYYDNDDTVPVFILDGLTVPLKDIFKY